MTRVATPARPRLLLPDLDRLWIRYAPRAREWQRVAPPGELRWLDLAAGELGAAGDLAGDGEGPDPEPLELPAGPFDDTFYLPPVDPAHAADRDDAAVSFAADGTPVLVQVLAGDEVAEELAADGIVVVRDLLEALLAGDPAAIPALPGDGTGLEVAALWPLIPGLTDDSELVEEGCRRLAAAGVTTVQGVAPDLPAAQRRQLYEQRTPSDPGSEGEPGGEEDDSTLFQALFHGPGADARAFARVAHRYGLRPFLPRPLPRPPLGGAPEREAAGLLALAGELAFRLGKIGAGQAHLRAARWIDRTAYDLRSLAREGNLPVLHWLDDESREIVEEWAETGESKTVQDIERRYFSLENNR